MNVRPQLVPDRRQRLAILGICSMSLLIVGLDTTIVNVALPAIHRSFHSTLAGLQWTIDAYTLVLASLLMLSGSIADRIGRRRIFQLGLGLFSVGSLLCAVAPTLGLLVAARVLQAVGGSMLNPVAMSIIRNVFVDPRERARAIGVWGAVIGISMALGPVLGGVLVVSVGWRAVFIVNFPIGVLAMILTARLVPESKADSPRRVDPVGQILVIVALATLTYAIIEAPLAGWLSPQTIVLVIVSVACSAGLVRYELHRREPLLDVRFFRSIPFSGATAIAVAVFAALGGFLLLNTLYLQDLRGLSPLTAGLYLLPMAAMVMILAPLAGRIVSNRGSRLPLVAGGLALAVSGLVLTQLSVHTSVVTLLLTYALFGAGFGLVNAPITNTAVSGMPAAQAGVAAAVASTGRQVGQTLGVAILGALAAGSAPSDRAFAASTHASWWIVVGLGLLTIVLGLFMTSPRAGRTADAARKEADFRQSALGRRASAARQPTPVSERKRPVRSGIRRRVTGKPRVHS